METTYIKFVPDDNQYGKPGNSQKKGRKGAGGKPKAKKRKRAPRKKPPAWLQFAVFVVGLLVTTTKKERKKAIRK